MGTDPEREGPPPKPPSRPPVVRLDARRDTPPALLQQAAAERPERKQGRVVAALTLACTVMALYNVYLLSVVL